MKTQLSINVIHEIKARNAATFPTALIRDHGLIAYIHFGLFREDAVTKSGSALVNSKNESDYARTTEMDPKYIHIHGTTERLVRKGKTVILYTVDCRTVLGKREVVKAKSAAGLVFPSLANTPHANKVFYCAPDCWTPSEGRMTLILTTDAPRQRTILPAVHVKLDGKAPAKTAKRARRNNAAMVMGLFGRKLHTEQATAWVNGSLNGDSANDRPVPALKHTVLIERVAYNSRMRELAVPFERTVLQIIVDTDTPEGLLMFSNIDGAGLFNADRMNEIGLNVDANFEMLKDFDGLRITMNLPGIGANDGSTKNHMVAPRAGLLQEDFVVWDPKTELQFTDDSFEFHILGRIHRPRQTRMDIQSAIIMKLAEAGLLEKLGFNCVADLYATVHSPEQLLKVLGALDADEAERIAGEDSDQDGGADQDDLLVVRHSSGLAAKLYAHAMDRGFTHNGVAMNYRDVINGVEIENSAHPLLQPKIQAQILRLLTQQMNKVAKCRFVLRPTEALSAYVMFDLSIMEHSDPLKSGRGFFFNNGVLRYGELAVGHVLADGLKPEMLNREAVLTRTPLGDASHIVRHARLVNPSYYAAAADSCYVYGSTALLVTYGISFLVDILGKMGGADLDDLAKIWLLQEIIDYVRSEDYVFYPNEHQIPASFSKVIEPSLLRDGNHFAQTGVAVPSVRPVTFGSYESFFWSALEGGSSLLGTTVNASLMYTLMLNHGLKMPDAMKVMELWGIHQEVVIDAAAMGKGHGVSMSAKIKEVVDHFLLHVTEMERRFVEGPSAKFPAKVHELRAAAGLAKLQLVDTAYGKALTAIELRLADFVEIFNATYGDPTKYQMFEYMRAYQFTRPESQDLGYAIYCAYGKAISDARKAVELDLERPEYMDVTSEDRIRLMVKGAVKAAAQHVFRTLTGQYAGDVVLIEEAFIALYLLIYSKPLVVEKDGAIRPYSDSLLFEANHFDFHMGGLRRAKSQLVDLMNGVEIVLSGPLGQDIPAEDVVVAPVAAEARPLSGLRLAVVNGWKEKDPSVMESVNAFAATSPVVDLYHLDSRNQQHMTRLWAQAPEFNGKYVDVICVHEKTTGFFAFVPRSEVKKFALYTKNAARRQGVLSLGTEFALAVTLLP